VTDKQHSSKETISIRGARQHNLKNISVDIPRSSFVVITGMSGSGKSSLAFNTLYAEGQRKYVESLSTYARQFLDQLEKPDVDSIEGLSPAIAIEQRNSSLNPRSTIATSTEIYDYLRILYSSIGTPHDPATGEVIKRLTIGEIVEKIIALPERTKVIILAPIHTPKGTDIKSALEKLKRNGFVRARLNGKDVELDADLPVCSRHKKNTIEAVIDRVVIKEDIRSRLFGSVETALRWGNQNIDLLCLDEDSAEWVHSSYTTTFKNPKTGFCMPELTPKHFSFNSHLGACENCQGLGSVLQADPDLFITDDQMTISEGAIKSWWSRNKKLKAIHDRQMNSLCESMNVPIDTKYCDLCEDFIDLVFNGANDEQVSKGVKHEGLLKQARRLHSTSKSEVTRQNVRRFMNPKKCPSCRGKRLRPEFLSVTLEHPDRGSTSIDQFVAFNVNESLKFIDGMKLSKEDNLICNELINEISKRLKFLETVGLTYLTLDRKSGTLSGGESQRIRLATQIGSGLSGVLYVLDEPSIGLHQSDNKKLIQAFKELRDLGNTVIAVEHDTETIEAADYVIDLGPGAGPRGGEIIAEGTPAQVKSNAKSITGKYLSGELKISTPKTRIVPPANTSGDDSFDCGWITIEGAEENNLKNVKASFPVGCITCVSGISGSGKSTLVDDILRKALFRRFHQSKEIPGKHDRITGLNQIDKAIVIDQSPIGRSPRSNPVTYSGAFTEIRKLFAQLPTSKIRGYGLGRFSFNVKGGRCEHCRGDGSLKIDMHFLSDVYVRCEVCNGSRYDQDTLDISYKGKNISEVLEMSIDEASQFFVRIPKIYSKLRTMSEVGLGYIKLGQAANTLSGGEAQRLKLASELSKKSTGDTIYLLDEPTTGLHLSDIDTLLKVLMKLRDAGNTLIIIEHNLDVLKCADWLIDMGPDGGPDGGTIVAEGSPEVVSKSNESVTAKFLKHYL